jgi:molybdenum cofactor biosynthesis enzyme MoaA
MKPVKAIDQLTQDDLRQADELVAEIERWFEQGNDRYTVNTLLDTRATDRVWWEVVGRASQAGWDMWFRGTMVTARRRRQSRASEQRR